MIHKIPLYDIPTTQHDLEGIFRLYQLKGSPKPQNTLTHAPYRTNIPHRHNFYEIFIFIQGQGVHEIDFVNHLILSPSIHFIAPGQVHLVTMQGPGEGYLLAFHPEYYTFYFQDKHQLSDLPFFRPPYPQGVLNMRPSEFAEILLIIESLKQEYQTAEAFSDDIIRAYLHIFLRKSQRRLSSPVNAPGEPGKMSELMQQFTQLIEKHFGQKHLVKDYAEMLCVTPIQLNKVVSKITGRTASDLIADRIILEVKRQLCFSPLTHKEIAHQLNYEDPSYFSRFFKRKTGFSPSEFRRQMKKKYQN